MRLNPGNAQFVEAIITNSDKAGWNKKDVKPGHSSNRNPVLVSEPKFFFLKFPSYKTNLNEHRFTKLI